jgi:hypothetical protein
VARLRRGKRKTPLELLKWRFVPRLYQNGSTHANVKRDLHSDESTDRPRWNRESGNAAIAIISTLEPA